MRPMAFLDPSAFVGTNRDFSREFCRGEWHWLQPVWFRFATGDEKNAQTKKCKVPRHPLHSAIRTSFTLLGAAPPAVHRGGPLAGRIEFADQATAVVHQNPPLDSDQLHPFPCQRFADLPSLPLHLQLSSAAYSPHFGTRLVFPSRWVGLIASLAAAPDRSRRLHP